MNCYIVTFEIISAERKNSVKNKLKEYGAYCPINDNCWAIATDQSAVAVRDNVGQALNPDDRIFVIRSGTEAAWKNAYGNENSKWLKERL